MNQWRKDIATWRIGETLYLSVPFTWLLERAEQVAGAWHGPVIAGGPAVSLMGCPGWAKMGKSPVEPLLFHNPCATFTTRGCPNCCAFCAVPKIEGEFRELPEWRHAPVICDNNLLAASRKHIERVIESLKPFPACDFNQGLDARLFNAWHADLITTLRNPMVRFSLDSNKDVDIVAMAIERARTAGLKHIGVYVLIGYNDTPDDARARLEFVRSMGIRPNPMRYQPLNARHKNEYVAPGWTADELQRMTRYYSRLRWLEHIPYDDFEGGEEEQLELLAASVGAGKGGDA